MRRGLIGAALVLGLAGPAGADGLEFGLALASGADLVATEYALRANPDLREGNPLAPPTAAGRAAVKVAGTAGVILLYRYLRDRHAWAAKVLAVVGIVAWSAAAAWNMREAHR